MKKLQVLGPGCPKCVELAKRTEAAAQALGGDFEVEKVSELGKIMAFGVMMTPALVVDGVVKSSGHLLSPEQIKKLISV